MSEVSRNYKIIAFVHDDAQQQMDKLRLRVKAFANDESERDTYQDLQNEEFYHRGRHNACAEIFQAMAQKDEEKGGEDE